MAKVTMHKASDGSLHEKAKDCEAINVRLRMIPALNALASGQVCGGAIHVNEDEHLVVYLTDIPVYLADHADAIRKILNEALVVRKPRKPKHAKLALAA